MRCLYCGKQLPLLKKLTGGGEFCSEAHRQKYQEEYNKLALSRLLQTQNTDADAPHRGELVLASRHPALQAGRTPLRALEAPKQVEPPPPPSLASETRPADHKLEPLPANWTPGTNRTQRALPQPSAPFAPAAGDRGLKDIPRLDLPLPVNERSLPKPIDRNPSQVTHAAPGQDFPNQDVKKKSSAGKRDAFSFRPMEPFPQEVAKPAPPPPPAAAPVPAIPSTTATVTAPPAPVQSKPGQREPQDPPPAKFILNTVRASEPPPFRVLQAGSAEAFTKGSPPTDGWVRWEPDIQGGPGGLGFSTSLLPLPGPPGWASDDGGERPKPVRAVDEGDWEREEIRKKILENQVKPGEFKQTVPKAPEGLTTVLPICPPAAALERVVVTVRAKAPAANPSLYHAPAATGADPWNGWTISGHRPIRSGLAIVPPEVVEDSTVAAHERSTVPEPADAAAHVSTEQSVVNSIESSVPHLPAENGARPAQAPVVPVSKPVVLASAKPFAEPPRNYKAAEALKSAAQSSFFESAVVKAQTPPSDQPSPRRHEVFVDLSVLGIEEDEDADAESLAREGESPPGAQNGKAARRKHVAAREIVRDLVSLPHSPVTPATPKLAYSFRPLAWKQTGMQPIRLSGEPLRPKVVFERLPDNKTTDQSVKDLALPEAKAESALKSERPEVPVQKLSSRASEWSAKRLKKIETGAPPSVPGDSGPEMPVIETLVSEPDKTVVSVPRPAISALTDPARSGQASNAKTVSSDSPKSEAPAAQATTDVQKKVGTKVQALPGAEIDPKPAERPEQAPALKLALASNAQKVRKPDQPAAKQSGAESTFSSQSETKPAREEGNKAVETAAAATINAAKLPLPEPLPEVPAFDAPVLGAGLKTGSFWANLPVLPKIAIFTVLAAAAVGGVWMRVNPAGKTPTETAAGAKTPKAVRAGASLMNLPGGWSPDWGGDFNRRKNRTISFYRPSAGRDDYRIQFEGQVESKGLGWVFRAADPKNYYAYKIELVRTGSDPGAALTHFSMVNGVDSQKHYEPLLKPIRAGIAFQVRLDVRDDEFSVYINDELVEVWQDDHLSKGGIGLMTELGESAQVRKLQVFELAP